MTEGGVGQCDTGGRDTTTPYLHLQRQAVVAEWVDSQTIFKVCTNEMGYEVKRRHWDPWWRQAAGKSKKKSEGHVRRYFGSSKGEVTIGIQQE